MDVALFSLTMALLFSVINYIFGLSRVVWAKAEAIKSFDLIFTACLGTLIYIVVDRFIFPPESFPTRIAVVSGILAAGGFVTIRYRARLITGFASRWLNARRKYSSVGERVLIIGAGEMGEFATWLFTRSKFVGVISICGIVDDDPRKVGMVYSGFHVLGTTEDLPALVTENDIGVIIYAITKIDPVEHERIMKVVKQIPVKLVMLPDVMNIIRDSLHNRPADESDAPVNGQTASPKNELEEWFEKVNDCLKQQDVAAASAALQEMQNQYHRTANNDD
jgi:FlaA1/EpsC-like NDP-sugar epimerase